MTPSKQRRIILRAGLATCAAWFVTPARACEYQTGLLRVTHPWTRATAHDATVAVLCMRFDEVSQADRLIGVSTPVASGAEMSGVGGPVNVAIAQGSEFELTEAGLHVRLTGLKQALQVGREYPLTLEFERAGTLLANLSVDHTAMRFR